MEQVNSFGERWYVPFNSASPRWMEHLEYVPSPFFPAGLLSPAKYTTDIVLYRLCRDGHIAKFMIKEKNCVTRITLVC